jgi:hypothetical protein
MTLDEMLDGAATGGATTIAPGWGQGRAALCADPARRLLGEHRGCRPRRAWQRAARRDRPARPARFGDRELVTLTAVSSSARGPILTATLTSQVIRTPQHRGNSIEQGSADVRRGELRLASWTARRKPRPRTCC